MLRDSQERRWGQAPAVAVAYSSRRFGNQLVKRLM